MSRRDLIINTLRSSPVPLSATALIEATGGGTSASNLHTVMTRDIELGRIAFERYKPPRGKAHRRYFLTGKATQQPVAAAAPRPKAAPTKRLCLCCNREFRSTGSMNRLCDRCRNLSVSPYALAI